MATTYDGAGSARLVGQALEALSVHGNGGSSCYQSYVYSLMEIPTHHGVIPRALTCLIQAYRL